MATPTPTRQLRLGQPGDLPAVRKALAKIVRDGYREGTAGMARFRSLVYSLQVLAGMDRHLADRALADRLQALEAAVERLESGAPDSTIGP